MRRFSIIHALCFYVFHNIIHPCFVGLPLSLLPSRPTWLCSAIIGSLPFSILVTCPSHVSLRFLILSTIVSFCSIFSRIISLRILFHVLIFLVVPLASSFLLPVASSSSHPCC